jgi:hypothetical protein
MEYAYAGGFRFLHLTDTATGQSVLVGTVKNQVPRELQAPNPLVYHDAFDGAFKADVVLTWKHNALSQDVVFLTRPELAAGFGTETSQLEAASEFLNGRVPTAIPAIKRRAGLPDQTDLPFLRFGGWKRCQSTVMDYSLSMGQSRVSPCL